VKFRGFLEMGMGKEPAMESILRNVSNLKKIMGCWKIKLKPKTIKLRD
jgi:hypothetical protein